MGQEIEKAKEGGLPATPQSKIINLADSNIIDLSHLSDDKAGELQARHFGAMIDLKKKAGELQIDVGALNATLGTLNTEADRAAKAGIHATMTHTQTTSIGRTEVVIGNTERAAGGKISTSAAGLQDRMPWVLGIGAVVLIVLAMILRH